MSKLTKFFKHPVLFFQDAKKNSDRKKLNELALILSKSNSSQIVKPIANDKPHSRDSCSWVPNWYISDLQVIKKNKKKVYLYIPWIQQHTDDLINSINNSEDYDLIPLCLIDSVNNTRKDVLRYSREEPHHYRKLIVRKLVAIADQVDGIILTFDWSPSMRIISDVCRDLDIARILIPHESVFADREKYYWDPISNARTPNADVVFGWGDLQKDIFIERGLDVDRYISVGAPKFDKYVNIKPKLTKNQFTSLFGLDENKRTILFATQPLDSQFDTGIALNSQRQAILDLIQVCEEFGLQVIIRLPPSDHNILNAKLRRLVYDSSFVSVDYAACYLVEPQEAIYHCDIVASVNSTMLFEAFLMNKLPISTKYVEFDQIWEKCEFPIVKNLEELRVVAQNYLENGYIRATTGLEWAKKNFSNGEFDGKASNRIVEALSTLDLECIKKKNSPLDRLFNSKPLDVIAIPSSDKTTNTTQKYLNSMLRANHKVNSSKGYEVIRELSTVDIFFQWGITSSNNKLRQKAVAQDLGKKVVYLEDGFLRSLDIGLSGEPGLSIIIDDLTSYYDATQSSRLELLLESETNISDTQLARVQNVISSIRKNRISKYNHAPDFNLNIGLNKHKILLLDQRYNDQSILSGKADQRDFDLMLAEAINNNPKSDILIKQHPDAIKGGKESYFNNEKLRFTKDMPNVFVIDYDVNPHSLFDIVDEVYVATSGMGFEALMAGKKVTTYGVPFYSGWGVTSDKKYCDRRTRSRSVEEIFYFSYIYLSRYYSPSLNQACEIEEVVKFIENRKKGARNA